LPSALWNPSSELLRPFVTHNVSNQKKLERAKIGSF
jgi:hypothetical protein